LQTIVKVDEA